MVAPSSWWLDGHLSKRERQVMSASEWARSQPTWALTNMVKALSSPVSQFLNTADDAARLEAAREELAHRKDK